jgi:hypothetical protein
MPSSVVRSYSVYSEVEQREQLLKKKTSHPGASRAFLQEDRHVDPQERVVLRREKVDSVLSGRELVERLVGPTYVCHDGGNVRGDRHQA